MIRQLFRFPGGLRLAGRKESSTAEPIGSAPIPAELVIPLRQHLGSAPELLVAVGDKVLTGQPIARADGHLSAAVHASASGTVIAIEPRPVPHPSGLSAPCVVIASDGEDAWVALPAPIADYLNADPALIRERVRESGIVGLGGAAFPTAVKLEPQAEVDTLILNAAECEPYISCDDMLLRERATEVLEGLRIIRRALGARHCLIGIEDNKPEACEALRAALGEADDIELVPVPTRYPAGGERQLIYTLTGREVPSGGLPIEIGILCHNVGTAAAVYDAVARGRPLIERVVTVTGAGVSRPRNLRVRLGTPMRALIEHCGGYTEQADRLLMGGPMMGFTLPDDGVPVVKASNSLLVGGRTEFPRADTALPCIRCGACAEACPAQLLPQQLYWFARSQEFERAREHDLFDCIECGACAVVCPSHIPLVQYYRYAKSELWAQEDERRKAELARERYEFRLTRLERDKAEQAEKRRQKKEALRARPAEDKQAAIAAAVARAQQKKATQPDAGDDKQAAIAAAIARAQAKKAASAEPADPRKAEIAAAIARAQQKKAAQQSVPAAASVDPAAAPDPADQD